MPWPKIIFAVIFAVVYAGIFAVKKLNEQAALKRAREEKERQKLDSLRTGRSVESAATVAAPTVSGPLSSQDAARRLQELAERRRLQLEELRRRAAAQAGGAAPAASAPPPKFAPATVPAPRARSAGAPARQGQRPSGGKRPVPTRPTPARGSVPRTQTIDSGRRERALLKSAERVESIDAEKLAKRAAPQMKTDEPVARTVPTPAVVSRPTAAKLGLPMGKAGHAALRRIMVLREVLAPPLALRRPDHDVI